MTTKLYMNIIVGSLIRHAIKLTAGKLLCSYVTCNLNSDILSVKSLQRIATEKSWRWELKQARRTKNKTD